MMRALHIFEPNHTSLSVCTFILVGAMLALLAACSDTAGKLSTVSRAHYDNQLVIAARQDTLNFLESRNSKAHVVPLREGATALASRLDAIDHANKTLDISLFILREDDAGHLFVHKVLAAADRGVKVRLLFDDLFNRHTARSFLALGEHANIEVRIFNPYARITPTSVSFILNYEQSRRRMHSRFQIADGTHAIIGGRNIADEYFADNGNSHFLDFEVSLRGKSVLAFTNAFEVYWNDPWSKPLSEIQVLPSTLDVDRLRRLTDQRAKNALLGKYRAIAQTASAGPKEPKGMRAELSVISDDPAKLRNQESRGPFLVSQSHFDEIAAAKKRVLIVTPYFIPTEAGARLLEKLSAREIQVEVVTNSLASTNHTSVHGGYVEYRTRLLRAGVKIFELKPHTKSQHSDVNPKRTLHSKYTVIDGSKTIVTTMNFDPISLTGNLETSALIRSQPFARKMLKHVTSMTLNDCYGLQLDENGTLVWHERSGSTRIEFSDEPEAALGRHFISDLISIMNIEGML